MATDPGPTPALLLGPMLRHVDETSATIWVETARAGSVAVHTAAGTWTARTFAVHGHHYALVALEDLAPGAVLPYRVAVDGLTAWPDGPGFRPPVIRTREPGRPLRLAFGSCRTSVPHDAGGNRTHGVDALRAYAVHMAAASDPDWPDLALLLGDQVYADSTSAQMQEFIRARRDISEPPGAELRDFEEYAHLYRLAWSDPAIRWLLSTVPTAMIFDDHDIRDDWNASRDWRRAMAETSWWQGRIVSGLAAYWVYQHLGNLSPAQREEDPLWRHVADHRGPDEPGSSETGPSEPDLSEPGPSEPDLSGAIDEFAARADRKPASYRWSYCRDFDDVRLLVVDSRAARQLEPGARSLLDDAEKAWIEQKLRGGFRHLLVGTSLPFLLPRGLHHLESWNEAISDGAWGSRWARIGEVLRRTFDLEHWAAFQRSFRHIAQLATDTADGRRGPAPETITFLSGDVHFSYVSEVRRRTGSRIIQAVCSPMRNPLPRVLRYFTSSMAYGPARLVGSLLARSTKVPSPPLAWSGVRGPWFDNNLALLEDAGRGLRMRWVRGTVVNGDHLHPRLETVAEVVIDPRDHGGAGPVPH